jgi:hypothetical protein
MLLILWSPLTTSMEEREMCYSFVLSWTPHYIKYTTKETYFPCHPVLNNVTLVVNMGCCSSYPCPTKWGRYNMFLIML